MFGKGAPTEAVVHRHDANGRAERAASRPPYDSRHARRLAFGDAHHANPLLAFPMRAVQITVHVRTLWPGTPGATGHGTVGCDTSHVRGAIQHRAIV